MIKNLKIKYLIIIVAILLLAAAAYWYFQYRQKPLSSPELTKVLEAIEKESVDSPIGPLELPQLGFDVPLEIGSVELNLSSRPPIEDAIKVQPPEITIKLQ